MLGPRWPCSGGAYLLVWRLDLWWGGDAEPSKFKKIRVVLNALEERSPALSENPTQNP